MKSKDVRDVVESEANKMANHLETTAPRGETGVYASSFEVTTGLSDLKRDRAAAFVANTAPYATVLEVGAVWMKNPPQPITRFLAGLGG